MIKRCFVLAVAFAAGLFAATGCNASSPLRLVSPRDGATVPTLREGQKAYLKMPRKERVAFFADPKRREEMKALGYYPEPTELVWTYDGGGEVAIRKGDTPIGKIDHFAPYEVEVSRLPDRTVVFSTNFVSVAETNSVKIDNLEIARSYQWKVASGKNVAVGTFTTEDLAPRLIRIPGVPNVRDLGGRIGLDGRRVKQGMVIRTAGLNNNASETFYTKEELIARDPSLKVREDAINAEVAKWKAVEAKPGDLKMVTAPLQSEWTVFFPPQAKFDAEGDAALKALAAVPEEFLGCKGEKLVMEEGVTHDFGKEKAKGPAVMIQEVEASDDGWMSMSAGGDYWWNLRSNGEIAFDLDKAGNWRGPYTPDNYCFPVPVKKGRNLIAVTLRTGAATWSWGYKSAPSVLVTRLAHDKVRSLEKTAEAVYGKVSKGKVAGKTRLTPETQAYMTKTLGIRSDIDLRSDSECWGMEGSPLGDTVTWFHISSSAYGNMQKPSGKEAFAKVFKVFLDEKNYPIDFHCIAGQDRTGVVAFIINGLLGVAEEELYLDWESTGFWNGSSHFNHRNLFDNLVAGFNNWPGETINEKIEAYVLSLGFTKDDIAKLRSIMLD